MTPACKKKKKKKRGHFKFTGMRGSACRMWHKCQLWGLSIREMSVCITKGRRRGGRTRQHRAQMALERWVNVSRVYSTAPKCQLPLTLSAWRNKDCLRLLNDWNTETIRRNQPRKGQQSCPHRHHRHRCLSLACDLTREGIATSNHAAWALSWI